MSQDEALQDVVEDRECYLLRHLRCEYLLPDVAAIVLQYVATRPSQRFCKWVVCEDLCESIHLWCAGMDECAAHARSGDHRSGLCMGLYLGLAPAMLLGLVILLPAVALPADVARQLVHGYRLWGSSAVRPTGQRAAHRDV
jgi:hypothetical protein